MKMKKKRSKWAKRCSECSKVLGIQNESLLCCFHYSKKYRAENKDKVRLWANNFYKRNKEKFKEYNQKPEVKERRRWCSKKYRTNNKDKIKEYEREYNRRPDVKLKRKEYIQVYNQKPEVKAKRRERDRIYNSIPKNRERKRIIDRRYKAKKKLEKLKEQEKIDSVTTLK